MKSSRIDTIEQIKDWLQKWNNKDIDAVMELFHDEIIFENWTSVRISGKESLKKMLQQWFTNDRDFIFNIEDIFYDKNSQKISMQWLLTWPSIEKDFIGKQEKRRGIDIMHMKNGKIYRKITYSKTTIEIGGKKISLKPVKL